MSREQPSESSPAPALSDAPVADDAPSKGGSLVAEAKRRLEEAQRAAAQAASVPSPVRQGPGKFSQGRAAAAQAAVGRDSIRSAVAEIDVRSQQDATRRDEVRALVERAAAKAAEQGVQVSQAMRRVAFDRAEALGDPEEQALRSMLADAAAQAAALEAEAAGERVCKQEQLVARNAALAAAELDYNAMLDKATGTFERRRERTFVATVSGYRRAGLELELCLSTMAGASFQVCVQSSSRVADVAEAVRCSRCLPGSKVAVKLIGPQGTLLEPFRLVQHAVDYELDDSGAKVRVDVLHVAAQASIWWCLGGEYLRVPDFVRNGAPVYKRAGHQEWYFYKGKDDRWFLWDARVLARDFACTGGWISHPDEAGGRLPHVLPAEKWRVSRDGRTAHEYVTGTSRVIRDTAQCDPAISVKEASALQVSKPRAPHEDKGGEYVLVASMLRNGAPVYKHTGLEWYLYKGTDDRWAIGGPKEKVKDFACTGGDIQYPEQACGRLPSGMPAGRWQAYDSAWQAEPAIGVAIARAEDGLYYPLSTLQGCTDRAEWRKLGLLGATRWKYLQDWEFVQLFGMSKESFEQLPAWKQRPLKQKHDLF